MRPAVVLLSGGLDSAVTLAIVQAEGYEAHALSFRYGQRHAIEIAAARRVAEHAGVTDHRIAAIDLRVFGSSALTDDAIAVPKQRRAAAFSTDIPVTYVPARNTIFLSYALAFAEVIGATDIFIGVNAVDYSGYPDCRPEFLQAFERLGAVATKAGVEGADLRIRAPLLQLSKADIVRRGAALGVPFALTHSCYDQQAGDAACGHCDSCALRLTGFREAGLVDPITYASA